MLGKETKGIKGARLQLPKFRPHWRITLWRASMQHVNGDHAICIATGHLEVSGNEARYSYCHWLQEDHAHEFGTIVTHDGWTGLLVQTRSWLKLPEIVVMVQATGKNNRQLMMIRELVWPTQYIIQTEKFIADNIGMYVLGRNPHLMGWKAHQLLRDRYQYYTRYPLISTREVKHKLCITKFRIQKSYFEIHVRMVCRRLHIQ